LARRATSGEEPTRALGPRAYASPALRTERPARAPSPACRVRRVAVDILRVEGLLLLDLPKRGSLASLRRRASLLPHRNAPIEARAISHVAARAGARDLDTHPDAVLVVVHAKLTNALHEPARLPLA